MKNYFKISSLARRFTFQGVHRAFQFVGQIHVVFHLVDLNPVVYHNVDHVDHVDLNHVVYHNVDRVFSPRVDLNHVLFHNLIGNRVNYQLVSHKFVSYLANRNSLIESASLALV
jgi:hypothetical protein